MAIESGMISIEQAFMPAQPTADAIVGLVAAVMGRYNTIVAEVNKEARNAK